MLNTATVALVLLLQGAGNPTQQPAKGSIEGIVLQSVTGESLDRARLTLSRLLPQTGPVSGPITLPPQIPPLQTEKDGKFIFKDLDAGQYRLSVLRNGYAGQQYGQRTATSAGTVINLTEGQQLKDLAFRLIPAATITGRVRDSNGEPVPGFQVSLLRSVYNVNGQRNLSNVGNATTDDRGEYRIFWVAAGRYVLSVGGTSGLISFISSDGGSQIIRTGGSSSFADRIFPVTYFPGTLDPSRATVIELQPGAELNAVDVILTQPAIYRIRGKVVDAASGKPPASAGVSIAPRLDPGTAGSIIAAAPSTATVNYNNVSGAFEIRNVIPGAYWLRANSSTDMSEPINVNVAGTARNVEELLDSMYMNSSRYAQIPIEVTGTDIESVELKLTAGLSIPMRLRFEGQDLSSVTGLDRIRVNLRPANAGGSSNAYQALSFNAEGTAILGSVSPGEYRIQMAAPSPEMYLKEVTFERTDVLNRPWEITSQTSGTLNIVFSNKGGQVEGSLVDAKSQPVRGSPVILIPDQGRDRPELYKTATTDQNGRFTLRGITPGGYRAYAWEAIEANAWYDREILSQYEALAKPIRIQESSKESVDLKIIPAENPGRAPN
jgi:hypothetical protein